MRLPESTEIYIFAEKTDSQVGTAVKVAGFFGCTKAAETMTGQRKQHATFLTWKLFFTIINIILHEKVFSVGSVVVDNAIRPSTDCRPHTIIRTTQDGQNC